MTDNTDAQIATAQGILEELNNTVNKELLKLGKYMNWSTLYFYGNDIDTSSARPIDPRGTEEYIEFLSNTKYLTENPIEMCICCHSSKDSDVVIESFSFFNLAERLSNKEVVDPVTGQFNSDIDVSIYSDYFVALKKFNKWQAFINYLKKNKVFNTNFTIKINYFMDELYKSISGYYYNSSSNFNKFITSQELGDGSNNTIPAIYVPSRSYGTTELLQDYTDVKEQYEALISSIVKAFKDCENLNLCYANSSAGNIGLDNNVGCNTNIQMQAIAYCCEKYTKQETTEVSEEDDTEIDNSATNNAKKENSLPSVPDPEEDTKATKKIIMIIIVAIILVICFIIGGSLLTFFIIKNNKSAKINNTV